MEQEQPPEVSEIQRFYEGCSVFVTGATGFMGKVLIEKLLRSTKVDTIYVLIRAKKGKDIHARLEEIVGDTVSICFLIIFLIFFFCCFEVFDRLREEKAFKHRLVAVAGDCALAGLGLSHEEREMLISKVHVIFHVAATVKFDENLKLAFQINVSATRDVLELARQTKNLKVNLEINFVKHFEKNQKLDISFHFILKENIFWDKQI